MTTQTEALDRLIEAVDEGEFDGTDGRPPRFNAFVGLAEVALHCVGHPATTAFHAYTGSLDAAKALHEALLPGWRWSAHQPTDKLHRVGLSQLTALRPVPVIAEDATPARAWLLAVLKAYKGALA